MSSTQEPSQNNESTINNPPGSAVKRLRVSNGFASGSSATSACEFDNAVYSPVRQVDQANIAVHDKIEADDKVRGQTFADQYHNLVKPHLQLPHKPPSLPLQVVNEQSFPDVRARCAALERLVQQAAQRIAALEQQERQSIKELGARWNVYHHQELYKTQAQLTTALQKEIDLRVMVWQDAQNRERQLVQSSKSQHEALQARIDKQHEFIEKSIKVYMNLTEAIKLIAAMPGDLTTQQKTRLLDLSSSTEQQLLQICDQSSDPIKIPSWAECFESLAPVDRTPKLVNLLNSEES